jgi:hypothetical protein
LVIGMKAISVKDLSSSEIRSDSSMLPRPNPARDRTAWLLNSSSGSKARNL